MLTFLAPSPLQARPTDSLSQLDCALLRHLSLHSMILGLVFRQTLVACCIFMQSNAFRHLEGVPAIYLHILLSGEGTGQEAKTSCGV